MRCYDCQKEVEKYTQWEHCFDCVVAIKTRRCIGFRDGYTASERHKNHEICCLSSLENGEPLYKRTDLPKYHTRILKLKAFI